MENFEEDSDTRTRRHQSNVKIKLEHLFWKL